MPNIITTINKFKINPIGTQTITDIPLPSGVSVPAPAIRPTHIEYLKRHYTAGQFSHILFLTELNTLHKAGVTASIVAPVATLNTAPGLITSTESNYYFTFLHKAGSVTYQESNLSAVSNSVVPTLQKIDVTGIPATSTEAHVTYVRLYRADNGGLPRVVTDLSLGVTSYLDNTATLALGAATPSNAAGTEIVSRRGVPPYCRFVEMYHDRAFYAGDPAHPSRLWFSEVAEPWAVGSSSYIDTRDGETITGLKKLKDQLVVFCYKVTYSVLGYSAADIVMRKISPSVGCIANAAIVNIFDRLWFPSEDGVWIYDGSFKFAMKDLRDFWRNDYISDPWSYQYACAGDDKYDQTYKVLINKPSDTNKSLYYVGHYGNYEPSTGSGASQPDWVFDVRARTDSAIGNLANSASGLDFFAGSCDGYIRKENDEDNADDDSDTYSKRMIVRSGHSYVGDPGGDIEDGKILQDLWTYVEAENNAWTMYILGGDEQAWQQAAPDNVTHWYKADQAASALSQTIGLFTYTYVPKTVHKFSPEKVSGRGFTLQIFADSPIRMFYRGFGGYFTEGGPASRRPATVTAV